MSVGSERATPTFVVPTSRPTSRGLTRAIPVYNFRNWAGVTIGMGKVEFGRFGRFGADFLMPIDRRNAENPSFRSYLSLVLKRMPYKIAKSIGRYTFLLAILMCTTFASSGVFKTPIYWREIENAENGTYPGRRLHDYLSLFPTYGDSRKLG